ncbi:hypothetical protein PVAG01_02836 [Phlyctema vagabunda]|uniref:Uncharacterized protein n=1 Tax=Phlyctema vagabunda TaxID=108571 RepID=A0ABR4PRT3_9HELO
MSFMSASSIRNTGKPFESSERPGLRSLDSRDKFSFRDRNGDGDNDRIRDSRSTTLRPRHAEGESDGEGGWSKVKPRKSFGAEGSEQFTGRMGGDNYRHDKRVKEREDRDTKERQPRGFENFTRDKERDHEHDHQESEGRRNGAGKVRNETWFKADGPSTPRERNSNGDRFVDRNRGWREKDREDKGVERGNDRGDRRWDRDHRQERDPEWMDGPVEEKNQAHTQEDFQKWKDQMSGKDTSKPTPAEEPKPGPDAFAQGSFFGLEKTKVETPLPIDTGPDKFFGMWAAKDKSAPESVIESKKEGASKAVPAGKSRFASLFTPQEEPQRRSTEPPPPMLKEPPSATQQLFSSSAQSPDEKEAFQALLQKLQRQTLVASGSTPPVNPVQQPKPPQELRQSSAPMPAQDNFQQYRSERQDDGRQRDRNAQQTLNELLLQRQMNGSQPSSSRPDQMVSELLSQRQNSLSQSSIRPDQPQSRNSNTEFLMGLMQSAKAAPTPQRTEELLMRIPPQRQQFERQMPQQYVIDQEAQRDRNLPQRQVRPYDERPPQILQRPPPPPGLDHMQPGWAPQNIQLPTTQQRHVAPPPGLVGPGRGGMPMPQQMYPPGLMNNFPPDVGNMRGPPQFFGPPPPGFPTQMNGFPGPEMAYGGAHFDGRGGPPPGFRRQ